MFGGFSLFPPVIKMLLIANAAVFLIVMFLGNFRIGDYPLVVFLNQAFALMPIGEGFAVWQLFTYMFMHASFSHIFFNMFALWMFGMELENSWGSRKFLTYYLVCGLGAGLANLLIAPLFTSTGPTVGASGAIYGVLLAFGMLFPDRLIYIYFFVPIKAKYFVGLYMIFEFVTVGLGGSDGIAHFAHLGGAFVGLVYILSDGYDFSFLPRLFRPNRSRTDWSSPGQVWQDSQNISDAQIYDIKDHKSDQTQATTQHQIDEILDKISRGGYQSLTDEEKKILFEASKKLN